MHSTVIAAQLASNTLQQPVDAALTEAQLAHYRPDHRNIYGLDIYYSEQGGEEVFGEDLSNVYWTQPLDAGTARRVTTGERPMATSAEM